MILAAEVNAGETIFFVNVFDINGFALCQHLPAQSLVAWHAKIGGAAFPVNQVHRFNLVMSFIQQRDHKSFGGHELRGGFMNGAVDLLGVEAGRYNLLADLVQDGAALGSLASFLIQAGIFHRHGGLLGK